MEMICTVFSYNCGPFFYSMIRQPLKKSIINLQKDQAESLVLGRKESVVRWNFIKHEKSIYYIFVEDVCHLSTDQSEHSLHHLEWLK